ncbi:MAG: hypothetical protein MZV63_05010 [Marinilabiliales bacterium]|nr:hypothetical protein [Marinilabiliales bacterium]
MASGHASPEQELPNPGLTVTILKYMEDVTDRVLEGCYGWTMGTEERDAVINANISCNQCRGCRGEPIIIPW